MQTLQLCRMHNQINQISAFIPPLQQSKLVQQNLQQIKESFSLLYQLSPGHTELVAYCFGYQGRAIYFSQNLKTTACIIIENYSFQLEILILSFEIASGENATLFNDS